jgi:hypothetical protein
MPTQIYAASGTFPLKIRESLSTRFSGLLEYSATYLIEKGASSLGFSVGQSILTSSGTVKIFPAPRVTRSNDSAFDEVEVTAYGQGVSLNSRIVRGTEFLELSKTYTQQTTNPDQTWNWTVYESWRCQTATLHSVILNSSTSFSQPSGSLEKTMVRRWEVGSRPSVGTIELQINWAENIRDISRTNYGDYDEVAVMKGYTPQVL